MRVAASDLIRRRMRARDGHYMSPQMLQSQLDDLERPNPEEAVVLDIRQPVEALVDEMLRRLNGSGQHDRSSRQDEDG